MGETLDPWAGSYFMESLTDEIESEARVELNKIAQIGGDRRHWKRLYAESRCQKCLWKTEEQKKIENKEEFVVGVNCFTGPDEIDVKINRSVEEVYSADRMASAEQRQKENLQAQALDYESYVLSVTMKSEDFKEGFTAFLEKREPVFKGK